MEHTKNWTKPIKYIDILKGDANIAIAKNILSYLIFVLKIITRLKSLREFNKFRPGDSLGSILWKNFINPTLPIEMPIF